MHGDADDVPIDMDLAAYEQAASPKWFVTLLGAEHRLAFTDEASPYDELVTTTLLDFWHGTLDGDDEALDRVTADATDPELSASSTSSRRRTSLGLVADGTASLVADELRCGAAGEAEGGQGSRAGGEEGGGGDDGDEQPRRAG